MNFKLFGMDRDTQVRETFGEFASVADASRELSRQIDSVVGHDGWTIAESKWFGNEYPSAVLEREDGMNKYAYWIECTDD